MLKKYVALLLTALTLAAAGCSPQATQAQLPTEAPVTQSPATQIPTPVADSVSIVAVTPAPTETPVPTPTPSPTPEPTPVPAPTAIPFSYYAPTVNMTFEELIGGLEDTFHESEGTEANWPKGYPSADTYYVIVDEYWQVVMVYTKDANGEYTQPVRYMLCTTGSKKLGPTRKGIYPLKECRIRFGTFAGGDYAAQYWTLIVSRTYFHSILYTKKDFSTLIVKEYNNLGTRASHGCIRLPVPDARWIWYNLAPGTQIEIRVGSKSDEATKAIREQLKLAPVPDYWPQKLLLKDIPYTDNWRIEDVDTTVPFVNATPPPVPKS